MNTMVKNGLEHSKWFQICGSANVFEIRYENSDACLQYFNLLVAFVFIPYVNYADEMFVCPMNVLQKNLFNL